MANWGFWEWVAYATMFIGAVILAADQGFKGAPAMKDHVPLFIASPLWSFAPLILLIVGALILICRDFEWIGQSKKNYTWAAQKVPLTIVAGKRFFNERVVLDGKDFRDCTFLNLYQEERTDFWLGIASSGGNVCSV